MDMGLAVSVAPQLQAGTGWSAFRAGARPSSPLPLPRGAEETSGQPFKYTLKRNDKSRGPVSLNVQLMLLFLIL